MIIDTVLLEEYLNQYICCEEHLNKKFFAYDYETYPDSFIINSKFNNYKQIFKNVNKENIIKYDDFKFDIRKISKNGFRKVHVKDFVVVHGFEDIIQIYNEINNILEKKGLYKDGSYKIKRKYIKMLFNNF